MSGRSRVEIPAGLEARRALGAPWGAWLDRLPGLVEGLQEDWELTIEGAPGPFVDFSTLANLAKTAFRGICSNA